MRMFLSLMLACGVLSTMSTSDQARADEAKSDHECALNFEMKTIDGESVNLEDYEGNVVLVVNVASRCGNTGQYAGLQALYEAHKDDGLVIVGVPCNQFGGQEPGSEADIKEFCSTKYNVTFPMLSKVEVNGEDAAPMYKYMTGKGAKPLGDGPVKWNFEKFLIDREGQLAGRFSARTQPSDKDLVAAIKAELAKK